MRAPLTITLLCCLAGCDGSQQALEAEAARKAENEAKLAAIREQFSSFLEEASKGVELLESHPSREAIGAEVQKLQNLLDRAASVHPDQELTLTLADDGRRMLKFFDACLGIANLQSKRTDISAEIAKKYIDKTCEGNAGAIRQLIEIMRADMGR